MLLAYKVLWQRFSTTRTLSEMKQFYPEYRSTFVRLPDINLPPWGHRPRRNSPVRSTESLLSAYLTEVLHYQDTVRDGTILSGERNPLCPLTWQRFSTTRTLSGTEQSCPENWSTFVRLPDRGSSLRTLSETEESCPEHGIPCVCLPDRGSPLRGHCPGRNSPVRRRGQRSSPGPADRGTCWESGRSEPAGLWSKKKENLLETDFYLSKSKVYACVNIHIYLSLKNVSLFVARILQRCSSRIYVFKDCKEYTQ
jgi:hypothetical protein